MQEQVGLLQFLILAGIAVVTIVIHAKLKQKGHLLPAIGVSLAGIGIMIYYVMG